MNNIEFQNNISPGCILKLKLKQYTCNSITNDIIILKKNDYLEFLGYNKCPVLCYGCLGRFILKHIGSKIKCNVCGRSGENNVYFEIYKPYEFIKEEEFSV